jgi:hypothetical protein
MAEHHDLRVLVDGALRANKTLVGYGMWSSDHRNHCRRWARAIEIAGEIHGMQIEAKYYLANATLKFRLLLTWGKCVWRIDFADDEEHSNPLTAPAHPGEVIAGPHYHAWADNRHYARANSLPSTLRAARLLPTDIATFAGAFRWFCERTNIHIDDAEIPALPPKDLLL